MPYITLYAGFVAVTALLGLGYVLSRRYEVSPYMFAGMILLIATFFSLGWIDLPPLNRSIFKVSI
jgi:hypothetical protein